MMNQLIKALTVCAVLVNTSIDATAQTNKYKKSRYYQNSTSEPDFNVKGFYIENEKNEVDEKPVESEYDVKISRNERDSKYRNEKRVIDKKKTMREERQTYTERAPRTKSYYTTYCTQRVYDPNRSRYDRYYEERKAPDNNVMYTPPPAAPAPKKVKAAPPRKEKEIKMTNNESEYQTTVVKKRYTNLDILCDDLDLAKIQRPVFKGICSECDHDVDIIITNKNLSSLEKNYRLKQCYMLRDKRLREVLDDDQYRKWIRIKDADEYLILTKDPELKDGLYK
jgi:hypothetical protein